MVGLWKANFTHMRNTSHPVSIATVGNKYIHQDVNTRTLNQVICSSLVPFAN